MPDLSNMLAWWQWLILAAIPPAVVALYFLKLKRRPVEVPSTYLWHKSIEDLHVNSIWQRLRRNLLLWLQLLLLLLAILAVLRPSWQAFRLTGSRFIFLVDNSASMQATDVRPSRLDEARRRVGELIDQMRGGDAAMIISFSDTARVQQNFTDNRQRLREALAAIQPTCRSTSLAEALKLAAGLVNPAQVTDKTTDAKVAGTRLFILSDGKFPPVADFELGNLEPVFVPIGTPAAANVGIVTFSVGRHETKAGQLQAFARLANFGPENVSVLVKLFFNDGKEPIDADRLAIPAGEARGVTFDLGGLETGTLRLEAASDDALAVDDRAYAVLNAPRRARVLVVTSGNEPLVGAVTTKAAAELAEVRVEPPDFLKTKPYADQAEAGAWDLVVYDGTRPQQMPRANTFFIGGLPPAGGWAAKPEVAVPQIIDVEVSHPLLRWIDLGDIHLLAAGTPLIVPAGGRVLVDSDAGPLLALGTREAFEDLVLGFKLLDQRAAPDGKPGRFFNTDWPLRVSFASFLLNLLETLGGSRDGLAGGSFRPGSTVTVDGAGPVADLRVQTPSGQSVGLPASPLGKASFMATEEIGIYRVFSGGKLLEQFAVNLADAAESDLRPPATPAIKIGYVEVAGQSQWRAGHREIWRELLVLGLAVLLWEWYTYLRRIY